MAMLFHLNPLATGQQQGREHGEVDQRGANEVEYGGKEGMSVRDKAQLTG